MTHDDFLKLLQNVKRSGNGHTARCPSHDDTNNSLSISQGEDDRILVKCFAGCGIDDIVNSLGIEKKDLFFFNPSLHNAHMHTKAKHAENTKNRSVQLKNPVSHTCTLNDYAKEKKLPEEFLLSVGLKDYKYQKQPAIRISYLDENGHEKVVRYRISMIGKNCFRYRAGCKSMLYGLWRAVATDHIILCEGESDCHTLWFHELPAYGIPGAATWSEKRDAPAFEKFARIYIIVEPDTGGDNVKKWLSKSSIRDRAYLIDLGEFEDPSGLYLSDPKNFKNNIKRFMDEAVPWAEVEKQRRQELLEQSWGECKDLARRPSILDDFAELLSRCGLAGERKSAQLLYLSLTTRILDRIVNNIVEGPSAVGKSFMVEKVLQFFPEDTYFDLTSMSDRALVYTDKDLRHIFIVLFEAAALSSEVGTYIIRSLLSENKIKDL